MKFYKATYICRNSSKMAAIGEDTPDSVMTMFLDFIRTFQYDKAKDLAVSNNQFHMWLAL